MPYFFTGFNLPNTITSAQSLHSLRRRLKTYLFQRSFSDTVTPGGPCDSPVYLGHNKKFRLDYLRLCITEITISCAGAHCNARPVATGLVICVCDWLRDETGLDFGDRSWICNATQILGGNKSCCSDRSVLLSGVKNMYVCKQNDASNTPSTCQLSGRCTCLTARLTTLCLKKIPTFKLSVTVSNLNRFSKYLHCWKVYKISYETHTTIPTSP